MPVAIKQGIQAHEMEEILFRFGFEGFISLSALQVGQAMHRSHANHCSACREIRPDIDIWDEILCGRETHHFYGAQCDRCIPDGLRALLELDELGYVQLSVTGTATERAKEIRFQMEAADLLDPSRDSKQEVPQDGSPDGLTQPEPALRAARRLEKPEREREGARDER